MGLYEQLEDEVIADIARRVKNTGRYTETAELMAKSMVEQGYSADKIRVEVMKMLRADKAYQMAVAENTKAYKQEIQDIIDQIVKEAKEAGNELVAEAGSMAWNNDLSMWEEHGVDLKKPNTMNQLLTAFKAQTVGELRNLTKSMGFKNTVLGTTGVLNAYQREMYLALLKVATGTFSYDQAVDDCVHRLAQSGLRSIDYASGRTYQLDTAARMSVRTGMSQLAGKIMEANIESTGQDLVITSQHMGSRPEHVPWQNKVFSYSGKSKKYPDFFKETGYGTAAGLKGVNCTHDFYPFWEGSSVIPEDLKEPEPVTINGKEYTYYEATQQQRKMERNIRATKREIEAQNAIGGSTTELRSKLRKQTAEYKSFSVDAGLKVRDNRLRVGKGTSALKNKSVKSSERVRSSVKKTSDSKYTNLSYADKKELIYNNEKEIEKLYSKKKQEELNLLMSSDVSDMQKAQQKANDIQKRIELLKAENTDIQNNLGLPQNAKERFLAQTTDILKLPQDIKDDELGAVGAWTRTDYTFINQYLRYDDKGVRPESIQNANTLKQMIDRNVVEETFTVRRGSDYNALNHLFGSDNWKKSDYNVSGKIIQDDGFMATTPFKGGGFGGEIQLYIDVPKGAKGAYLGDKSAAPDEKEFLLQAGTKYMVDSIETWQDKFNETHYDVYMRVIVDE